jgi:dephospho-CoA kinase
MLKVGLTGSIAVGKSFVCNVLAELGCRILDADRTARDVVKPGTLGLQRIVKKFGQEYLTEGGELDRPKMAAAVFADSKKRELLNSIIHPLVIAAQDAWIREQDSPGAITVIDAALMIESGGYKRFDKIVVVWCEPEVQLERLMNRDGLNAEQAMARISSQMPQEEKKKYADFLIDTTGGFDAARAQTKEVYRHLVLLNS